MNAALRLLVVLLSIASVAYSQTSTDKPWSYSIDYSNPAVGKAIVTGYSGAGGAVVIPSTLGGFEVVSIGEDAFRDNSYITILTIPNSVISIGRAAFNRCSGLTSVTIPNSVKTIGDSAFGGCSSLTSIVIPDSVTSLGFSAFQDCTSLTSVTIGNGVKAIGGQMFYDCTSLTSVTIGNSVITIHAYSFSNCRSLTSVTIPDSVTGIDTGAFQDCSSLASVTIGNGVKIIPFGAFQNCISLTNVTLGNSVSDIRGFAFLNCSSLTSITIPESITSIGESAFKDCTSLESVYFLGNMPSVGGALFGDISPAGKVFYPRGNITWGASYVGWPTQPYILPPLPPPMQVRARVRVEHPAGATLVSSVSADPFPTSLIGVASPNRVYTLRNTGNAVLSNIVVAKSGPNSAEFSLTPPTSISLAAGAVTTFSVGFLPSSSGSRTAQIFVTSSDTNNSPFLINLSGSAVSADADTDGDGLNDAAEVTMSDLGFNWQNSQPDLVRALMSNANQANLFTKTQFDANRTNGRSDVTTKPSAFGLYTLSQFNANRTNGRTDVIRNPSSYSMIALTNVPSIRLSTKRGNTVSISMPGSWTRYAQSGMPRGWKFDAKKGILRGTIPQSGMPSIRLTPYRGSSPGAQVTVQFQPTAK